MNFRETLTYGLAALTLALTPARAAPPQPNAQGQICLPPQDLERVCKDNYCPPAPECPSKRAKPRIPRSKCTDYYKDGPGIGICLNEDDARRLESLDGVILEKGPDNLCPWGKSYHCYELDVEKVTRHVDRPVDRLVERRVEVKVIDPETQRALEEAQRHIQELEKLKKSGSGGGSGSSGSGAIPQPQNEVYLNLGGLARFLPDGATPAFNVHLGYQRQLGGYFFLGVEGMLLLSEESAVSSTSLGQELLPDGNRKYSTDVTSTTTSGLSGGVGGILGVRLPFGNSSLYGELTTGAHALWGKESGDKERTTYLSLPDGTVFMGPKTISEPQGEETKVMFGVTGSAGVGIRLPLGNNPADPSFVGSANVIYLYIPTVDTHSVGGAVKTGVNF